MTSGEVVVEALPGDEEGRLIPPEAGEVVLSVPSPETLTREADDVRRVIGQAGTGTEPLVILVEAADELREEELEAALEAAERTARPVILRVIADG